MFQKGLKQRLFTTAVVDIAENQKIDILLNFWCEKVIYFCRA